MLNLLLKPISRYWMSFAILLSFNGCSETPSGQKASGHDTPSVQVVNYPLQYFAERIGGELIEVEFSVPPDVDPAFWRPDAEAVVAFQRADLIFLNGAGYAQWIDRVSLPVSRLVDTSAGFREDYIEIDDTSTHQHGPQGEHTHGEIAFTTWVDPTLGIEQARAIMTALSRKWPDHAETFESNFKSLEQDLSALDADLKRLFSLRADEPLLASHPVYQYLARRYGLEVISLHWEPEATNRISARPKKRSCNIGARSQEFPTWGGRTSAMTATTRSYRLDPYRWCSGPRVHRPAAGLRARKSAMRETASRIFSVLLA